MTAPLSTGWSCDLPAVHATIAPLEALISARRGLYQFAVELLDPSMPSAAGLPVGVLDNPESRGRIGAALRTGHRITAEALLSRDMAVADGCRLPAGNAELLIASHVDAQTLLADALAAVEAELFRATKEVPSIRLLTIADGDRFLTALELVRGGLDLARSTSPALIDDLLPHIGILGLFDPRGAEVLGSASSRHFPGLVLMPAPRSATEVAEALVHEGAHQKLFDLAITHSLLTPESDRCPPFEPCWPPVGRRWPMEQALAAGHAYACLARFALDAEQADGLEAYGDSSLLRTAGTRSQILGNWLFDRAEWLGTDAHTLLAGLLGRRPQAPATEAAIQPTEYEDLVLEGGWTVRRCGDAGRALAGRHNPKGPPELLFVAEEVASIVEFLSSAVSKDDLADMFAQRYGLSKFESVRRIAALGAAMAGAGLVRMRPAG
jgi:hypothetical protein